MTDYTKISSAVILRDYTEVEYQDNDHEMLVDIADGLHNVGITIADMLPEAQVAYYKQTPDFWQLVLDDMSALDSQVTRNNWHELLAEYQA